jgi:hypothetical protein
MRTRTVVFADPRDGRQEAGGSGKGPKRVSDARFDRRDSHLEGVDLG